MKNHLYLLILAILGLMTSCSSDDITESNAELEGQVFTAETEMPGDTRTSLSPDRYIYWTEGDQISIFNKITAPGQYELSTGAGTTNGDFRQISSTSLGSGSDIPHVVAVYPYKDSYTITNTSSTGYTIDNVVIPSEQTYVENSFSQGAMPMVAVTSSHNLKFKNVGALIKLNIKALAPGVEINKITLESRSTTKEVIAGKSVITIDADGQNPFVSMESGSSTMITLNCKNVKLSETTETSFYLALPAMNFVNGFIITIYDAAAQTMTLKSKACDIKRNQILVMPSIVYKSNEPKPTEGKWIDLGLPSGIKWASFNVGANSPEEYGNYYSWGEITTKTDYSQETYSYCHKDKNGCWVYDKLDDFSGNVKYDAARANWGEIARMPTSIEVDEIKDGKNCTSVWTTYKGVKGMIVTSKINGNSIFLPASGYCYGTINSNSDGGYYWSSTPVWDDRTPGAYIIRFYDNGYYASTWYDRAGALPVRPVSN